MKKLMTLLALCLSAIASGAQALPEHPRQCGDASVNRAIATIVESWKNGYNEGDPDKVADLYADDATYMTQHFVTGIVYGKAAIRAYVNKGTDAKYRIEELKVLSSDCSGDFAYVLTRYSAANGGQKVFGVNLVVLKKLQGKWMIVAHESAVPDPATAIQSLDIVPEK